MKVRKAAILTIVLALGAAAVFTRNVMTTRFHARQTDSTKAGLAAAGRSEKRHATPTRPQLQGDRAKADDRTTVQADARALKSPVPENLDRTLQTFMTVAGVTGRVTSAAPGGPGQRRGRSAGSDTTALLQTDDAGRVLVSIWTRGDPARVIDRAQTAGAEILAASPRHRLVEAWVAGARLGEVARLGDVLAVTPVYRPMLRAGSVQTQGDVVIRADVARTNGIDGAPVLVGVLSDAAVNIGTSQGSTNLPPVVDRYIEFDASDEGRAMLEIVHDIAPGARLAHHSGLLSELSFAEGIRKLAAAGARVMVDDLWYFSEPFFQDGIVAQAVMDVMASNDVTYIAAAGNEGDLSYEADFNDDGGGRHDFDPSGATDTRQQFRAGTATVVRVILQWDDPFYTTNGVTHDFDLRIYDAAGALVAGGTNNNVALQQPLEIASWTTPSTGGVFHVEIERVAGSGPSRLKYVIANLPEWCAIDEFATSSGTVVGHPAVAGAIAVGAVPYYNPATNESYSSVGDATIRFDRDGNRLAVPEVRQKPDLVAPDAVNTSFFGTDIPQDADTHPNFAGTSAAAPHVGGAAALVLAANPHLTREELYAVLENSATDLGAPGRDRVFGAGLVDAEAARTAALAVADVTPPHAAVMSPIIAHAWPVSNLLVRFSEPMHATGVTATASYELRGAGADQAFGTGDDVLHGLSPAYDDTNRLVMLGIGSPATNLPAGIYRLTIASNGITDPSSNPLCGGTNLVFTFAIAGKSAVTAVEGTDSLACSPDGTAILAYPINPVLGSLKWPHVRVGRLGGGGNATGPFVAFPSDGFLDSFEVNDPDVVANAGGGLVTYSDHTLIVSGPDDYDISYMKLDLEGRPVGNRIAVATAFGQTEPKAAMNGAGRFAIAWSSQTGPGDERYVWARRYETNALPLGAPFAVSEQPHGMRPVAAISSSGAVVCAWFYPYFSNYDGDSGSVYARLYLADGAPAGGAFRVNARTAGNQSDPDVAMAPDGSFIVVWSTASSGMTGVFAQRYDAAGVALGLEITVSAQYIAQNVNGPVASMPRVAAAADGRFVVTWCRADGDGNGVFARRFLADGTAYGGPIWISEGQAGNQTNQQLAVRNNGDFLVTWTDTAPRARWIAWSASDDALPFGPSILSLEPSIALTAAFAGVSASFDRDIDATTFTAQDVTFVDPAGRSVSIAGVVTTNRLDFAITMPTQSLGGIHRIQIGPGIADTNGILMDQNGNATNGEPADVLATTIVLQHPARATIPLLESFEAGSIDDQPRFWSYQCDAGTLAVSTGAARSGLFQFYFDGTGQGGERIATLHLDTTGLVGATNLVFEFWLRKAGSTSGSNRMFLDVSTNGTSWTALGGALHPGLVFTHYVFDLDAVLATAGLACGGDVYLRFRHSPNGGSTAYDMAVDDVRIYAAEPPAADFAAAPVVGIAPLLVAFTNASAGTFTNSLWLFGDGASSNTETAVFTHTFATVGTYTVSLRAAGPEGMHTNVKPDYVVAFTAAGDHDGDGMPNAWELTSGLDPLAAGGVNGASGDPDGDGMVNIDEYRAGTQPTNSLSVLRIVAQVQSGSNLVLRWSTAGIRTNVVQVAACAPTNFSDASGPIVITATGDAMTNFATSGVTSNPLPLFYRIRLGP